MNPIAIVIRVLVIAAVVPLAGWAFASTTGGDKSGGANIGAGLFAHGRGGPRLVWGIVDGRQDLLPPPRAGRWSARYALLGWAVLWLREGYDVATAMSDLTRSRRSSSRRSSDPPSSASSSGGCCDALAAGPRHPSPRDRLRPGEIGRTGFPNTGDVEHTDAMNAVATSSSVPS